MRIWGGVLLCALAICSLSAAPATAAKDRAGKPSFEVHERALRLSLRVKASHGYEGWVATEGHKRVTLTLHKGSTVVEARTRGRVTRRGIEAKFGELGEISVRFRGGPFQSGPGVKGHRCRGRKSELEKGVFSGTIRFRGENGFARVDAVRAAGYVQRQYRRVCRGSSLGDALSAAFARLLRDVRLTVLRASGRVGDANVVLEASAADLRPLLGPGYGFEYTVSARSMERRNGVRLRRGVSARAGEGSFLFHLEKGEAPRSATVAPPNPFTGTARYLKGPGLPASWAGSLAARLPGAGLVALTGSSFRADFCRLTFADLLEGGGCLPKPNQAQLQSLSDLRDRRWPSPRR